MPRIPIDLPDGLIEDRLHCNWGMDAKHLAKLNGADHHCANCKEAPSEQCFSKKKSHMGLCEICGMFMSAKHGCDKHDKPLCINIKMLERLDPTTNGLKKWKEYTTVNGLNYNPDTWEDDLDTFLLHRRQQYWQDVARSKLPENRPKTEKPKTHAGNVKAAAMDEMRRRGSLGIKEAAQAARAAKLAGSAEQEFNIPD